MNILAGDVGATKTQLAVFSNIKGLREPLFESSLASRDYPSLETLIAEFLKGKQVSISAACFGVAGPVIHQQCKTTNLPWTITADNLGTILNGVPVDLINDLQAMASAIPILEAIDLFPINTGNPVMQGTYAIIAPGTGLGEAFLIWDGLRYIPFPSEGGHADFAPVNKNQSDLLEYMRKHFPHVSYERVCSGSGIPNLYIFLRDSGQYPEPAWLREQLRLASDPTPVIINAAKEKTADICTEALNLFISILGSEAGNMALKVMATGGVYIGGGLIPRLFQHINLGLFMEFFIFKGRFTKIMTDIPVQLIKNSRTGLLGAANRALNRTLAVQR